MVTKPLIAVYSLIFPDEAQLFGKITFQLEMLATLAIEYGLECIVLAPGGFDWERQRVIGYTQKEGKWTLVERALPDILIRKISSIPIRFREQAALDLAMARTQLRAGLYTELTGDKWEIHKVLAVSEDLSEYLPDTRVVAHGVDIKAMLEKHGSVFLKPAKGSQGKSVYRMSMEAGKVVVHRGPKNLPEQGSTFGEFLRHRFLGTRKFIVQDYLDLYCTPERRPVDFRWHAMKDGNNEWEIVARIARVGDEESLTTNYHNGGNAYVKIASELLALDPSISEAERHALLEKIERMALALARRLEVVFGRVGEIGFDIAVTKNLQVKLIEANARPGRFVLRDTDPAALDRSLRLTLEYAGYLVSQSRTSSIAPEFIDAVEPIVSMI